MILNILTFILLSFPTCLGINLNRFVKQQSLTDKPNILLIIVDDLRPSLGSYRDKFARTPSIDKIADSGIIFTKAYAQQSLCGPSRTSFLTSRRPDTTKLIDVHYYWRHHSGNFTTLPQFFKENGYHTVSAGKIFHPGIVSNKSDDQPYSWSEIPYHPSTQKHKNDPVCYGQDGKLHSNIYCPVEVSKQPERTLPDIQTTQYVIKWLRNRFKGRNVDNSIYSYISNDNSKPFFLAVGFHKPHIPLKFPVEFLDLFPIDAIPLVPNRYLPKGLPLVAWNPWNDLRRRDDISLLNLTFPFGPMPDYYAKYIRQGYYAATSYADSLIGLIMNEVSSLFPDTIVALIGDHGWSLGEHQEWSKFSNFEVATRVPFIITPNLHKYSKEKYLRNNSDIFHSYFKKYIKYNKKNIMKQKINNQYNGLVELLDLFPTLVDLVGLPAIPKCPAKSSNIKLCTQGTSLSCIISNILNITNRQDKNLTNIGHNNSYAKTSHANLLCPHKLAVMSQYPRPGLKPSIHPDSDQCRLTETTVMGYSLRTDRFRYTTWRPFNHSDFNVDWDKTYGEELYDHWFDEGENINIAASRSKLTRKLKKLAKIYAGFR